MNIVRRQYINGKRDGGLCGGGGIGINGGSGITTVATFDSFMRVTEASREFYVETLNKLEAYIKRSPAGLVHGGNQRCAAATHHAQRRMCSVVGGFIYQTGVDVRMIYLQTVIGRENAKMYVATIGNA